MRMAKLLCRHARESGHPVIAVAKDRIEQARSTGSSAFADDDGSIIVKRPGSLPAFAVFVAFASVRSALWRRCRPRLDQRVVVDGFALRLLVRQLALGRDVAVLGRLREPVLSRLLFVHLRSASALDAGFL